MKSFVILFVAAALMIPASGQKACSCGETHDRKVRSSNSVKTTPYYFPWTTFVAFFNKEKGGTREKCTGALIHESYVMTAAHCTPQDEDPNAMFVSFRQECGTKFLPKEKLLPIAKVFRNPQYRKCNGSGSCTVRGGDIAILKLATPQPNILPICLGISGSFEDLVVSGWGREDDDYQIPCQKVAELKVVSDAECHKYNPTSPIAEIMCAGSRDTSNICGGDSGSSLMTFKDDHWFAVAISSFGKDNCATTTEPSVFERISAHISWISRVTENAVCIHRDSGVLQTANLKPALLPGPGNSGGPQQKVLAESESSHNPATVQKADCGLLGLFRTI